MGQNLDGSDNIDFVRFDFYLELDGSRTDFSTAVTIDESSGGLIAEFREDGVYDPNSVGSVSTLSDLITFIDNQLTNSNVGLSIRLENGQIVLESSETGAEVKVGLEISEDFSGVIGNTEGMLVDTGADGVLTPGDLTDIVGSVSMDESNGTLTLTSEEAVREAFTISDADISLEPVKQQASVSFSTDDSDYFNGGQVSVAIGQAYFFAPMTEGSAGDTLELLRQSIEDEIAKGDAGLVSELESVSLDPTTGTLTLTASEFANGYDEISVGNVSIHRPGQLQVTELDLSGIDFEPPRLTTDGELPQVSVTVAGETITANVGVDNAETVQNLAQAIAKARDEIDAVGNALANVEVVYSPVGEPAALAEQTTQGFNQEFAQYRYEDSALDNGLNSVGKFFVEGLKVGGIDFKQIKPFESLNEATSAIDAFYAKELPDGNVTATIVDDGEGFYLKIEPGESLGVASQTVDLAFYEDYAVDHLRLTAKEPGSDPLKVSDITYDVEDTENSTAQEIEVLFYGDTTMDGLAEGSEVRVTLAGEELTYTVDADDVAAGNPSLSIAQGVYELLKADPRGLVDESESVVEDITVGNGTASEIRLVASYGGPGVMGSLDEGGFGVEVLRMTDNGLQPTTVAAASESVVGELVVVDSTGGVINDGTGEGDAQTGVDAGVLYFDGNTYSYVPGDGVEVPITYFNPQPGSSLLNSNEQAREGVAAGETEEQEVTNPSNLDDDFYGDSASTGAGNGTTQTFTNPDDGFQSADGELDIDGAASAEEGDAAFAGDAERSGSDGVSQTVTNPDGGYDAIDGSPAENPANGNNGDESLYGSDPGQYVDDGLETDFLSGGTDSDEDGVYEGDDLSDRVEIGDGSEENDGGVAGENAGEFANGDASDDGFDVVIDDNGFAAFDWDEATENELSEGNAGADQVSNFQTDNDVIALEGALAESTLSGTADAVMSPDVSDLFSTLGSIGTPMSLSDHEFGVVTSGVNAHSGQSVSSEDLGDADAVAALLNNVYNFDVVSHDTQSDTVNTTVFAVTASDDPDLTAIWAHTQSNEDDSTVEALELNLLATVETEGESFSEQNFAIEVDGNWQQPEILQPQYV